MQKRRIFLEFIMKNVPLDLQKIGILCHTVFLLQMLAPASGLTHLLLQGQDHINDSNLLKMLEGANPLENLQSLVMDECHRVSVRAKENPYFPNQTHLVKLNRDSSSGNCSTRKTIFTSCAAGPAGKFLYHI